MTQEHPITPPPELVQQWWHEAALRKYNGADADKHVTSMAAQWGSDQELEACCEWMKRMGYWGDDGKAIPALRAARRPKPPSLKDRLTVVLQNEDIGTALRLVEQLDD
jgi:hypothetical protein